VESWVPCAGAWKKDIAIGEKEIKGAGPAALANPISPAKAPPEVVAECRANLAEAEAQARWRGEGLRVLA